MNEIENDLPYRAEYAKSKRSSCRSCRQKIEGKLLRLAVVVKSPLFDGKIKKWYHFKCFFRYQRPKSVMDISNFESLRWSDQEKIRRKVKSLVGTPTSRNKTAGKGGSKWKSMSAGRDDIKGNNKYIIMNANRIWNDEFRIEYFTGSRSRCRGCQEFIIKTEIRACKVDRESDEGRRYGGVPLWHHLDCFVKMRQDLEFYSAGNELLGFRSLKDDDRKKVKAALPAIKAVKIEDSDEQPTKMMKIEDKESEMRKKQNEDLFKYRDFLKTLNIKDRTSLLIRNGQEIPREPDRMLDRLCDLMAFGALNPCPTCQKGQLIFQSWFGYRCIGPRDEGVKCQSLFDDPPRKAFVIPQKLKEENAFLAAYESKIEKRIFSKRSASTSK